MRHVFTVPELIDLGGLAAMATSLLPKRVKSECIEIDPIDYNRRDRGSESYAAYLVYDSAKWTGLPSKPLPESKARILGDTEALIRMEMRHRADQGRAREKALAWRAKQIAAIHAREDAGRRKEIDHDA